MFKRLNRHIGFIEAHLGLIWKNTIQEKCKSCGGRKKYLLFDHIDPKTGKWIYYYKCCYCGK